MNKYTHGVACDSYFIAMILPQVITSYNPNSDSFKSCHTATAVFMNFADSVPIPQADDEDWGIWDHPDVIGVSYF